MSKPKSSLQKFSKNSFRNELHVRVCTLNLGIRNQKLEKSRNFMNVSYEDSLSKGKNLGGGVIEA